MSSPPYVPLGNLMASATGSVNPAAYPDETFDLYSIPAFDLREPEVVRGREIGSPKQVVRPNDVLLSKIVPHIRRSWVVGQDRSRRLIASGEWIVFRSDRVHPAYLRQVLVSDPFHAQFMNTVSGVGGSLLRARPAHVANLQIPLPSLPEQRRIAEVLDSAEALRAKRRAAIAHLDTLTQSIFVEMFGDPVTNPKGWERVPFGQLLADIESGQSPICLDRPAVADEWGVLKLGAVTRCEYNGAANKALPAGIEPNPALEVQPGDLLFTRKNTYELVGACALVGETPPRLLMPDLMFRFRLRADAGIASSYLHQLLIFPTKRRVIQALAGGSAGSMPNISKERLRTASVERPPLALQAEFARRVITIKALKASLQASLCCLDTLFASLQHRAFRGEL